MANQDRRAHPFEIRKGEIRKTEDHFLEMKKKKKKKKKIFGSGGGRAGLETVVLRSPICWWVFRLLLIAPPPVQLPLLRLTDRRCRR